MLIFTYACIVCVYVCRCMQICTYVSVCVHILIHMCMYICDLCIYMYIHTYAHMVTCVHAHMHVYMCPRTPIPIYVHVHGVCALWTLQLHPQYIQMIPHGTTCRESIAHNYVSNSDVCTYLACMYVHVCTCMWGDSIFHGWGLLFANIQWVRGYGICDILH